MTIWRGSVWEGFTSAGGSYGPSPCEVLIDGGRIVVSYKEEGAQVVYEGEAIGEGHYRLACPSRSGRATLHRFPEDDVLEGSWSEGGEDGYWKVRLR